MTRRSFKDPTMRACYEVARRMGSDNFSAFFYAKSDVGPRWPHRGAGHRCAYWNGRAGIRSTFVRESPAYAYWAAGRDDRAEDLKRGGPGVGANITMFGLASSIRGSF